MAYAVKNGTLYTCDKGNTVIDHGTLLINNGKIEAILTQNKPIPEGYEVIDAEGKTIIPGFVNSHKHEGIYDASFGDMGVDGNEATNPSTPMIRVIDAINIEHPNFVEGVKGGVTTINTGPGSANVIGGQFALLKTWANSKVVEDYIIRAPSTMKAALGENPKRVYGSDKKTPGTRMGIAGVFRKTFVAAQAYETKWKDYEKKKKAAEEKGELDKIPVEPDRDLDKEVILKVLNREIPIHIHCHLHSDIVTAIRLSEEFNLDLMIVHGTEGHKIADYIAKKQIPVSVGPSIVGFEKSELKDITFETPAILHKAGVKISIQSDTLPRLLYFQILPCMAVKSGLPVDIALRAVTIDAAEMVGAGDRIGSLEPGKDADLVILDDKGSVQLTICRGNIAYLKEETE